jgi:hypothetical protein
VDGNGCPFYDILRLSDEKARPMKYLQIKHVNSRFDLFLLKYGFFMDIFNLMDFLKQIRHEMPVQAHLYNNLYKRGKL